MRTFLALVIAVTLSACATPYKSSGFGGGYSETQLDDNVFQVSFRGNGFTDEERAADFTLMRSAELALQRGFAYFVVVDSRQSQQTSTFTTPTTTTTNIDAQTRGNASRVGNSVTYTGNTYGTATTVSSGGQTYHVSKPRASNTIVCFEKKPDGFSYNAALVLSSIKQKYSVN